jgi:hypothetical protein
MKMPVDSWCKIESKEQWELWKSINSDAKLYGQTGLRVNEKLDAGSPAVVYRYDDGDVQYFGKKPDKTEYKLPNCGPIPEGWRLVDKAADKFTEEAKRWYGGMWVKTVNSESDGYGPLDYIIPIAAEKPAEKPVEKFPANHWFRNTPKNVAEFLRRFKGLLSTADRCVDESWFDGMKNASSFCSDSDQRISYLTENNWEGWLQKNGYTEFKFEHEKTASSDLAEFEVKAEKPEWVSRFVPGTCIKVTPENVEQVKAAIGDWKWSDGTFFGKWQPREAEYYLECNDASLGLTQQPARCGVYSWRTLVEIEPRKLPPNSFVRIETEADWELFKREYPGETHFYDNTAVEAARPGQPLSEPALAWRVRRRQSGSPAGNG